MRERPLSPHLSVYRFKYTMLTSFLNRMTGAGLSIGLIVLVWWLMSVASGARAYAHAMDVLSFAIFKVILAGLLAAFCYHLIAGIRHLIWDTGHGLERRQSQHSAWVVAGAAMLLFLLLVYWIVVAGAHAR